MTMGGLGTGGLAVIAPVIPALTTVLTVVVASLLALLGALLKPSGLKKLALFFWHQKLLSLGLAALIWFIFWGPEFRSLLPGAGARAERSADAVDWPLQRADAGRTGAAPGAVDPTVPEAVWSWSGDPQIYASPSVVGRNVYVSTVSTLGQFKDKGAIMCLDAGTGTVIWRFSPPGYRATFSSPSVAGDTLVCGEGLHWVNDARVFCLDALTGKERWRFATKQHVESSPCIAGDRVIVGAGDDGYYCLGLQPGPDGKARVLWHLFGPDYKDCETSPLVVDGVAYLGLGDGGNALVAVEIATGKELWRLATPYPVFAPPSVAAGKLYFGMGVGDFVKDADGVRQEKAAAMRKAGRSAEEIARMERETVPIGEVWAVDLKTRQVDWTFKAPRAVLGAVAVREDRLYFGSRDGRLRCLSTAGKELASFDAHEVLLASPALGREHVYINTAGGRLHCLRADTLEPEWDVPLGSGANFTSSPALALDHLYVGTEQDGLRCLGRAGAKAPAVFSAGERGGAVATSFLPPRLDLSWRYPKAEGAVYALSAPLLPHEGAIYAAALRDGKPVFERLRTGKGLADEARTTWSRTLAGNCELPPAAVGGEVYLVEGAAGAERRTLLALSTDKGETIWSADLAPGASGRFTAGLKRIVAWRGPAELACLDRASGRELWRALAGEPGADVSPVLHQGLVVAATAKGLLALDDESGARLWSAALASAPRHGLLVSGVTVVAASGSGLEARSLFDGRELWRAAPGPCAGPPVFWRAPPAAAERKTAVADDCVAVMTTAGELVVVSLADGKTQARRPAGRPWVPALPCGERLVFQGAKGLALLDPASGEENAWYSVDWGRTNTPLVLFEQQLFFGTDERGVVCLRPKK